MADSNKSYVYEAYLEDNAVDVIIERSTGISIYCPTEYGGERHSIDDWVLLGCWKVKKWKPEHQTWIASIPKELTEKSYAEITQEMLKNLGSTDYENKRNL